MTDAQRAAQRLYESTPQEKRHTHEWEPLARPHGYAKRTVDEMKDLRRRFAEMRAKGMTNREIRLETGCTNTTIRKYIGPCTKGRGVRRAR